MAATKKSPTPEGQTAFDFTQPLPDFNERGNYTMVANEIVDRLLYATDSVAAIRFVMKFARLTAGGEYSLSVYGQKAKALMNEHEAKKSQARKKGSSTPILRPMWLPLTMAKFGQMCGTVEYEIDGRRVNPGADKVKKLLEDDLKILISNRASGKIWYAIDYDRINRLKPIKIEDKKRPPKAEETNIPHDVAAEPVDSREIASRESTEMPMVLLPGRDEPVSLASACPSGEKCCLVAACMGGSDDGRNSQVIESIISASEKSNPEVGFRPVAPNGSCTHLLQQSGNHKSNPEVGFSPRTLVQKPGDSRTISLAAEIRSITLSNIDGHLSCHDLSVNEGVLVIRQTPPPPASDATTSQWRKGAVPAVKKYFRAPLGDAELANIAGVVKANGKTLDDWCAWLDKRATENGGRITGYHVSTLVKITEDDFAWDLENWAAMERGRKAATAPKMSRTEQLFAKLHEKEGRDAAK